MLEDINLRPSTREVYIKALKSGVESYMMNVSGLTLERVREDRKRWMAGYNIFVDVVEPKVVTPQIHQRDNAKPLTGHDRTFCETVKARMDALGMNGAQLARASGVSVSIISDTRNQIRPISPSSRKRIRRALDRAEEMQKLFGGPTAIAAEKDAA